jgi:radical SAM superfamily enzyme YgiQ (UPF0313 family)
MGAPHRNPDGTGKFFRQPVEKPLVFPVVRRRFARYGLLPSSIRGRLAGEKPDVILISSGMTYWYPGVAEAAALAREAHPGVPIGIGGVYATLLPEHCARVTRADFIVAGSAYPGLSRELDTRGLPAPPGPLCESPLLLAEECGQAMAVRLNTGCPENCRYCASRLIQGGFSPGDPALLSRVVLSAMERLGTPNFAFYDDALLVGKNTLLFPFLDLISSSGRVPRFFLPNAVHISEIDAETARRLHSGGFDGVRLGLESSEAGFHSKMDGKLDVSGFGSAVDYLRSAGFAGRSIVVYILAGLPGQRREEVEESVRFAASFGVRILLSEYSPVPGTALWEESTRLSSLPLSDEPLCQNNSALPMAWSGFGHGDLDSLKRLAHSLSPS